MTTRKPPLNVGLTAEKVAAALTLANGSPTGAARILGVTRNTVNYWRDRAGLTTKVTVDIPDLVA